MVKELYVWGPAFGLPSIDAQCLAAIAYLSHSNEDYLLVAANDPAESPIKQLPLLRDETRSIGGFHNILDHLHSQSSKLERDGQAARERADIIAYSSFIEFHGQQLLDLSLYVSSENYNTITRPEIAKILQWPQSWYIPPQLRKAAKTRTEHLDVFSIDLDSMGQEPPKTRNFSEDLIPKSLRGSRQTLSSLLQQTHQTSRFRLEALAEAMFNPLEQLLGKKRYMISDKEPSNLDYFAFAYLALAFIPVVPQSWLSEIMGAKHPTLCAYVENLLQEFFHGPAKINGAFHNHGLPSKNAEILRRYSLPWSPSLQNGIISAASALISHSLGALSFQNDSKIIKKEILPLEDTQNQLASTASSGILPGAAVALASGLVAVCSSYLVYSGVVSFPYSGKRSESQRTLTDLGEAGAILSFLDARIPQPSLTDMAPIAEVAVTVDNGAKI